MTFIIIPLIVIAVSQLIKLSIFIFKERKLSLDHVIWEGFWAGKFPSSHSALLASSFLLLVKYPTNQAIIGFSFFICLLFLYSLLEDKKRSEMLERYLISNGKQEMQKRFQEFNGHGIIELSAGIVLGLAVTIFLDTFL